MKRILSVLCLGAVTAQAVPYNFSWNSGFSNGGIVPDGNVAGWSDTRILSGISENSLLDVNVTLRLAGGWNGDLYAYLTHAAGFSILLNRAGRTSSDPFGYGDAGFDIVFDDSAVRDIHLYQTIPGFPAEIADGSAWAPDARLVDPLNTLETDGRTSFLSSFNGLDPNGSWTLFIADLSSGSSSSVVSWGLSLNAAPHGISVSDEPLTLPLLALSVGLICIFRRSSSPS
jgi:hypothetical protein